MRDMVLSDLKGGMVIETENKNRYVVVNKYTAIRENQFLSLDQYNDDLTRKGSNGMHPFDIKKVFDVQQGYGCMVNKLMDAVGLLWEEKPYVQEVTMADIEKKYGCKVRIINDNIWKIVKE